MNSEMEGRLREALEGFADSVRESPTAYQEAQDRWRYFERRRRTVIAVVVLLLVAIAVAVGVWVLSSATASAHVISTSSFEKATIPPGIPLRLDQQALRVF
ncbi:hypothetical protein B7755_003915 [Streptomyces sp. NBS 14/10]|uniref:hypothetical protein n=1 Tax=Streptomyces sp. NBS 14/10 TaxID=1945643 RepID=UPI000B9D1079|nr:hypothetical protein [Streptomyces sp. NBS 14/10]KAK1177378.1 hypothetical protein B7755_003915 [Streptomyces sp. NBS 14/10]